MDSKTHPKNKIKRWPDSGVLDEGLENTVAAYDSQLRVEGHEGTIADSTPRGYHTSLQDRPVPVDPELTDYACAYSRKY